MCKSPLAQLITETCDKFDEIELKYGMWITNAQLKDKGGCYVMS